MRTLLALIALAFALSCTEQNNEELDQLKQTNKELQEASLNKDSVINNYIGSLSEIQENLETIKAKEKIISIKKSSSSEFDDNAKENIQNDIQLIYKLLQKNKAIIASLNKDVKNSNYQIANLKKMIESLSTQLEEKDSEIENLKYELEKLNIIIEDLYTDIEVVTTEKDSVITELNTAFYVIGTEKELIEQKVLTKTGGFIGIGKMKKLMQDFNKDYFKKVDITTVEEIPLYTKEIEIITNHPSSSYEVVGKDEKIKEKILIKDPKAFWGNSKYLVILVK